MLAMSMLGYALSLLIGLSMGLIGAGGAILTVPILVYLFGVNGTDATGYSLFIVGALSLIGAFAYVRRGQVQVLPTLAFGGPSILGVLAARAWVVPSLPRVLGSLGGVEVTRDRFLLLAFGVMMVFGAGAMIRSSALRPAAVIPTWKFSALGMFVGFVTGMVGAGGGFLIVPALVCFAGMEMKSAIGSSLSIIAVNSAIGFAAFSARGGTANWGLMVGIVGFAGIGMLIGLHLSKRVAGAQLKPAFGFFVLAVACFLFVRELRF